LQIIDRQESHHASHRASHHASHHAPQRAPHGGKTDGKGIAFLHREARPHRQRNRDQRPR
jgi:hypothetical protein